MALDMIPPPHARPFLAANGWGDAEILPLAGDASFRRYFRVVDGTRRAVLMDAPPPQEDPRPFLAVANWLTDHGFGAPAIYASDDDRGLVLLEDFGDDRVGPVLARQPERERQIYETAVKTLVALASEPAPDDIAPYDDAAMTREVMLFIEWYGPALGLELDADGFIAAWRACWADLLSEVERRPIMVLRDYHADNLMVLPGRRDLGLLDFQDALAGHAAYDLVSLLQDARRDVDAALEEAMLDLFVEQLGVADTARFRSHYEVLGAQRNTKILGIFTRLWKRDGKTAYTLLQPRVWSYLERNLRHPALAPVRAWFDASVPADKRAAAWLGDARS